MIFWSSTVADIIVADWFSGSWGKEYPLAYLDFEAICVVKAFIDC